MTPSPAIDLPFPEFEKRLKKLQEYQKSANLDAIFILSEVNLYYFTGLVCDNGVLVLKKGEEPVFYTDFRYIIMAQRKAPGLKSELLWAPRDEQDILSAAGKDWGRIGYEGAISAKRYLKLHDALPKAEWTDISEDIMTFRSIKSEAEQKLMRLAIQRNDEMFQNLIKHIKIGMTEWEMRNFVRGETDRLGQGEAFATIACVGKNAAECHHEPDETVLENGQSILIDQGVRVNHYCSDMTRCAFFGEPTPIYKELHKIVHEANRKAMAAVKPGVPCCDIHEIARSVIDKAGYGNNFGHALGHSVGLEIHENPNFSPNCKTLAQAGMLITIEPGIYLPGEIGIRLEDMILVTETGCELLSQTPHDWVIR